jgi:HNH endonuclease
VLQGLCYKDAVRICATKLPLDIRAKLCYNVLTMKKCDRKNCQNMTSTTKARQCRVCCAARARAYRKTGGGRESARRYEYKRGKYTGRQTGQQTAILQVVNALIRETRKKKSASQRLSEFADRQEKRREEKLSRAFVNKIFQPVACADCGEPFETLFPVDLIQFGIHSPCGRVRCTDCAYARNLKNHGGGPRRRCTRYDVPYEVINPSAVFKRDENVCQLCGEIIDIKTHHSSLDAPELDHIWPLSLVVDGKKSPGHVLENVQAAHKRCNMKKKDRLLEGKFPLKAKVL